MNCSEEWQTFWCYLMMWKHLKWTKIPICILDANVIPTKFLPKPRLPMRFFTCSGEATLLKIPILEILRWLHAATKMLRQKFCDNQLACTVIRMGHRTFPGTRAETKQCVALPLQKTGYTLQLYLIQISNKKTHFVKRSSKSMFCNLFLQVAIMFRNL